MIKRLRTKNFTVLRNVDIEFSPDVNVIIGANGSGKTHIMKLMYSVLSACAAAGDSSSTLRKRLSEKLVNVFKPDRLGRLASRVQGRAATEVSLTFDKPHSEIKFTFATNSKDVANLKFGNEVVERPVYFPAKELLSIFPNFVSLYEEYHLPYDETYLDTMRLLGLPYARGPRDSDFEGVVQAIENAIGGTIRLDATGKSFHLIKTSDESNRGNMEIELVAEGWRKLGMLTQVVLNRALKDKGFLFWDEPEANLNPRLIKTAAEVIFNIATGSDIQVFVTTHSLFFLRELELLSMRNKKQKAIRYIGINDNGTIDQGDSSVALGMCAALDAELSQSERILSVEG